MEILKERRLLSNIINRKDREKKKRGILRRILLVEVEEDLEVWLKEWTPRPGMKNNNEKELYKLTTYKIYSVNIHIGNVNGKYGG